MEILIALVIVLAAGAAYGLWRWKAGSAEPALFLPPPAGPELSARLSVLGEQLASVGEASAHPRDLTANATFREAVALLTSSDVRIGLVTDYAAGANWILSTVACVALYERPDRDEAAAVMERQFRHLSPWAMYYALRYFTRISKRPPMGALILRHPEYWNSVPVIPMFLAEHFASRVGLGDPPEFGNALAGASPDELAAAESLLRRIDHPAAKTLLDELGAWRRSALDRSFLDTVGRFIEQDASNPLLVEHPGIKEQLAAAEAALLGSPARSVLVVGDPRAGKTSFLLLLARRTGARGWIPFEAGTAALMAGQVYIGQLEERVRRLMTELAVEKRVLWCVPDLAQFAASGAHQTQAASLLDQILPSMIAGKIVVASEATPAGLTALLQARPALRSTLEIIRLPALDSTSSDELAREVADRITAETDIGIAPDVLDTALHLARQYLGTTQMPGAALDLVKLTAQRVGAHERSRMERDDVLATLSQITGMPQLVLDDRERLDLASLRRFFAARVIGQEEAVDIVVDRIAMLKAGLTDPARPIGVFLFAGPTGTGKTELAKTLAAFLFGSADRLVRLDMSEFQAVESTRKIVGDADQKGGTEALTDRVRKQPFSVVLLDEFEKAHPNAWDLFLQVFDDGRLTDATGHTVDFRHCIIILTSNLGAIIPPGPGLGFASAAGAFSQEQVMRAVHQSFRPEFVNRLDAIIVFRPLTRELMRGILAKELAHVLERRGLRDREWAVEWESSALDFLLDKGFSPTLGARPLKRAIDRHLLAPLAATLVEHRFPEGDQFLFVRSDGRAIQVEFVDPDTPAAPAARLEDQPVVAASGSLARMMLQPTGEADERAALLAERQHIEAALCDHAWTALEEGLVHDMQQPEFWNRTDRLSVLARYALVDRVKAALQTARALEARLARSSGRGGRYSRDLVARLALQLYLVRHGTADALSNAPVEIALAVQPVLGAAGDGPASSRWCERLFAMYREWASRRHMQWEELTGPSSPHALAVLSGFGAARMLEGEAGLHLLEYENTGESARATARVVIWPTPDAPDVPAERHKRILASLRDVSLPTAVVRRYRLDSSPLIRDVRHGWRTGRLELVFGGHFDLLADVLSAST